MITSGRGTCRRRSGGLRVEVGRFLIKIKVDAEIARRETAVTLEADLKRLEADARRTDPLWDRKPATLRREVALAGVRGALRLPMSDNLV